jgi:hypothetical protein
VPALGKYKFCVTTSEHVKEINDAPIDHLSFNAAVDEVSLLGNGFVVCDWQVNIRREYTAISAASYL